MPKKKGKLQDLKKPAPVAAETNEYQLISLEENHAQQIKHENLIQRVWKIASLIEEVELAVKENASKENALKEWLDYLSCDKIPKPSEPQKIRNFFDKISLSETEDVGNTINWILSVDERSILSQDIDAENKTKMYLKRDRINFGPQYNLRICDTLKLIERIEGFLRVPSKNLQRNILLDIERLNYFAENKVCEYIDSLTYRVLTSEDAYMDPIDVTTAEYSYQGQYFQIHIWTFQNVPIHFDPEEIISKIVELHQIKVQLIVPFSVLSENMVIRGVHCCFDHLSSRARYNEITIPEQFEKNLKTCLQKEWESQKQIQAEVKANMIKERADYEEALRLKAEEEELKAKAAANNDKAKKPPPKKKTTPAIPKNLSREPPIVTPDLVPIVWRDFLEHDSQEYTNKILNYHPNRLNLFEGEVNLRQYQILGGVYHINSLSKPNAKNYPKLILTWYKSDKNFEHKTSQINSDVLSSSDDISKFFEITFELADCFCHWSEPMACIFEEHHSPFDVDVETREILKIVSPIIINDFNLHGIFTKPLMYEFLKHTIPRVISSFKFPNDIYNVDEDQKGKSTLGRTKTTVEEEEQTKQLELQKQILSFEDQQSPERLFPLFKNVLPVMILPIQEKTDQQKTHVYEWFSELMSTLDSIRDSYKKTTFKDRYGNPVKILAEEYDRNIRKPRITTKLTAFEEMKSTERTSLDQSGPVSMGSRKSLDHKKSLKMERLAATPNGDALKQSKVKIVDGITENKDQKHLNERSNENLDEKVQNFSKWSTTNILKTVFNPNEKKITIWTDRLGTFGFAFNRYQHFPFKNWSLQPSEEDPHEFELKIESEYALFRIYISRDGYKALVTDFSKTFKSRKVFLQITEPINDLRTFKKKLEEKFLNIFPEPDAVWYVKENFSEKHLAAELHTYTCMSLNASLVKFRFSHWNKQSNRRTMVLEVGELKESEQELTLIRVTPEDAMFVEINEVINDMGITELEYISTWRNLEWYADLNHLLKSNYGDANESPILNQNLIVINLKNLLYSIKPLSFS